MDKGNIQIFTLPLNKMKNKQSFELCYNTRVLLFCPILCSFPNDNVICEKANR